MASRKPAYIDFENGEVKNFETGDTIDPIVATNVSGGGSSSFLDLTDTPSSYVGKETFLVRVAVGETDLEFVDPATVGVTLLDVYPVGSIYTSVVSTDPGTLFGGTWVAFGAGRVMVGLDSGQTEFDTVEETGGAKTHTLTESEIPSHTHVQDAHSHLLNGFPTATGGSTGFTRDTSMSGTQAATALTTTDTTSVNQNTGGGAAHNNLQPYIVVYMFKRTV